MFGVFSLSTVVMTAGYAYVAVAIVRAEYLSNGRFTAGSFVKAATWPVTIFHSIRKLYEA
jgi:hypothetical protein